MQNFNFRKSPLIPDTSKSVLQHECLSGFSDIRLEFIHDCTKVQKEMLAPPLLKSLHFSCTVVSIVTRSKLSSNLFQSMASRKSTSSCPGATRSRRSTLKNSLCTGLLLFVLVIIFVGYLIVFLDFYADIIPQWRNLIFCHQTGVGIYVLLGYPTFVRTVISFFRCFPPSGAL